MPGTDEPLAATMGDADLARIADDIGYPLLVKAVSGGGGKGMRTVTERAELATAVAAARSEASTAFGDAAVYFERRLTRPRHVEVQLLGDQFGTVVPFVERECSIQRRHQKVVEETPSLAVSPSLRQALMSAAAAVARSVGYTSAGTVEFLLDEDGRFYFLEMNTRLQVEHPITELVTGVDLVHWQIRIARGERLDIDPEAVLVPKGHAIECRVYAEDPDNNFLPSPGRIQELRAPAGPGIRDDSGASAGLDVPIFYDPMISKLAAWAEDRPQAIARMRRALDEYLVTGIKTTVPFFSWLLGEPAFIEGRFHTTYLDEQLKARNGRPFTEPPPEPRTSPPIAAALPAVLRRCTGSQSRPLRGRPGTTDRWKAARLDVCGPPRYRQCEMTCSTRWTSTDASAQSSSRARATVLQSRWTAAPEPLTPRASMRTRCRSWWAGCGRIATPAGKATRSPSRRRGRRS